MTVKTHRHVYEISIPTTNCQVDVKVTRLFMPTQRCMMHGRKERESALPSPDLHVLTTRLHLGSIYIYAVMFYSICFGEMEQQQPGATRICIRFLIVYCIVNLLIEL